MGTEQTHDISLEARRTKLRLYKNLETSIKRNTGKNIILYSGGIDCFVLATYMASIGSSFELLHIKHNKVHRAETEAAKRTARILGSKLHVVEINSYADGYDFSPSYLTYISVAEAIFHAESGARLLIGIILDDHTGGVVQGTQSYLFRVVNVIRLHGSSLCIDAPFDGWSKRDVLGLARELNTPIRACSPCEDWSELCECAICQDFLSVFVDKSVSS